VYERKRWRIRDFENFRSSPFKERNLISQGIGEHECSRCVLSGDRIKFCIYAIFLQPGLIRASGEVAADCTYKGNFTAEPGYPSRDISCTSPKENFTVKDGRRSIFCREGRDPGDVINCRMTDNMNHNSQTSLTRRGTSRSAFPTTDFAIFAA